MIPTSFFNFIQLFLHLFPFFFIALSVFINAILHSLLTTSEDGRCAKFFATPLINLRSNNNIMPMNRTTKKAALGSPSSDETFPLREKTKF